MMRDAGFGLSLISERAVMVLPQPDSPTMPRVSPSFREKVMPSTAFTVPHRLKK